MNNSNYTLLFNICNDPNWCKFKMKTKVISRPYKDCGRVFNTAEELRDHIKNIHYDENLSINDM